MTEQTPTDSQQYLNVASQCAAELAALRTERDHMEMAADAETRRVDELTELRKEDTETIRQLVEALAYHRAQTRPIHQTNEAIIRGRARLEGKP